MKYLFPLITLILFSILSSCSTSSNEGISDKTFTTNLSTASLSFGSVEIATTQEETFSITNTGTETITITNIITPTGFSVKSTTETITTGSSKTFTVSFSPSEVKSYHGTITVVSNTTSVNKTLLVEGIGISEIVGTETFLININETVLDFGDTSTAATDSKNFIINNTGTGSISITEITSNSNFTVNPTSAIINAGENKTFDITFSPTAIQNYTQSITVISNATNTLEDLNLSGYGIDPFYVSTITPIISQNCSTTGCHNTTSKASGIAMTNFLETKEAFVGDKAWDEIVAGRMPRGRSLTQTQKEDLLKWIHSDYTNGVVVTPIKTVLP